MSADRTVEASYDYRDEHGTLLYQVLRYRPKGFCPRHPNGRGKWAWGLEGCRRVLYRLPELVKAGFNRPVFVCEGEKDVDTLIEHGLVATTAAGGAGAAWGEEYVNALAGRPVCLVPDNDDAGRQYMNRVAAALKGRTAGDILWLDLPDLPPKGDVSDWFAAGGTAEQLLTLGSRANRLAPPSDGHELIRLEHVIASPIEWLWKPWLPVGKLCLIDGDPGQGKSYITLDLAARLSRGDAFPDNSPGLGEPVATLLVSCEDGFRDTIVPRLRGLGADLQHIRGYQGQLKDGQPVRLPTLPDDLPRLEERIIEANAKLVVIDPLMAFLGASVSTISDQSVRGVLAPLAAMAERLRVTLLFVRHLNKTNGKQAIYRGGGSIGIIAQMRTAMLIARHPNDRDRRVLAMVKCNLGKEPQSLAFRLTPSPRDPDGTAVAWEGPVDLLANDLVGDVQDVLSPREWLKEALAIGPRLATELATEAAAAGISERTLNRAKAALGVAAKNRRGSDGKQAWWWLPPGQTDFPSEPALPPLDIFAGMPDPPRKRKKLFNTEAGPYAERI
ncbi:MAG: AAA family ATPase [Gemmataceae bacterium]